MADFLDNLKARLRGQRVDLEVKGPAAAPGGRLTAPTEERRTRRVYVGLDFGTCSCKAVVQIDPEEPRNRVFLAIAHPSAFTGAAVGMNPLLCPSTVDVRNDRFFFGYQAEAGATPGAVCSFKMCLPCLWPDGRDMGSCPRCDSRRPGHYFLGGQWWSVEDVSALFLAQVIRGIKDAVLEHLAGDAVRFFINSAAPLDQLANDSDLGRAFQRVLYVANRLSDQVQNGWPIADAAGALDVVKREGMRDLQACATTVFPETHAAMTSVLAPLAAGQNFGTVDIGAGTTDTALFYYHRTGGEPEACYYKAQSRFVGMDQLDLAVASYAPPGVSARRWREALADSDLNRLAQHFREPIDSMWAHFRGRLGESYMRNPGAEYWDDVTIFLTGGGSQLTQVVDRFRQPFNFIVGNRSVTIDVPDLPSSVRPLMPRDGNSPTVASGRPLLLLAYGLAHGAANIASWVKDYSFFREHELGSGGLVAEVPYTDM